VSINSIGNTGSDLYAKNLKENLREKETSTAPAISALSQVTDKASLSGLAPRLQGILKALEQPEGNVMQAVSENVSSLQDVFVDALYLALDSEGINLSQKLTLRLDTASETEQLVVAGEHPDSEQINAALAGVPELSSAFKEIAAQSELLRDVGNIGKVIGSRGLAGYENASQQARDSAYQISMKGEMSHFYFGKP
jgi:flagellin-specific chaperone FliS